MLGCPGIVDVSYIRMIQQGQGLALGLESCNDTFGIHAGLDYLQGHLPSDRLLLLG